MKNIKNMMAAVLMVAVLMVGTTFAKGGLLLSDLAGNQNTTCAPTDRGNGGIIINDGILVVAFTGIIIVTLVEMAGIGTSRNQTACRGGLLLSD